VVLALGILCATDQKHRHAAAVSAAHQDTLELTATHESESAQEEVVRLDHHSSSGLCTLPGAQAPRSREEIG
jgi:hypothetical protein